MHFVGVDLAWGRRKPTGLAALDDEGRLLHVSAVRTDDEIRTALAPYVGGACLVAIDAPLIVRNAAGNRPAEAALNRDFARFHAGAHPSNTGKPEFGATPRGAVARGRARTRHGPGVAPPPTGHRGLPASGHRGALRARPGPEVQEQGRTRRSRSSGPSCVG